MDEMGQRPHELRLSLMYMPMPYRLLHGARANGLVHLPFKLTCKL